MVEITYKQRKTSPNPRAAKLRETGYFYTAMQQAAQLKYELERLSREQQIQLSDMKPTLIPTDMLWFLADSYLDSYNLLLKENLIKSGNISKISQTIH